MPTAGGQSTQEKERQSRLHQNRFAQTLAQARQGFYEAPKKLKEAQREIFLATALRAEGEKFDKKLPVGQKKPSAFSSFLRRPPTLSGTLGQGYVDKQLARAEQEKIAGTPTPQPYSSRFRNAASRAMGPKFGTDSENQNETDKKNSLLQNQAQTRRGFPTLPVSAATPLYPEKYQHGFPTLPISPAIPLYPEMENNEEEEGGEGDEEEEEVEGKEGEEENEQEQQPGNDPSILQTQQLAQNQQVARQGQQRQAAAATLQKGAAGGQMNDASKQVRKTAEKAIRRGVEELAQLIGNAFDAGTVGISTLVTIFMYIVNGIDFSMQMFTYYIKNNLLSFLFPPLDGWDPIPLSTKIVPVVVLHAIVVLCDILVIGFVVIAFILIIIIMFGPQIGLAGLAYAIFNNMDITTFINSFSSAISSVK